MLLVRWARVVDPHYLAVITFICAPSGLGGADFFCQGLILHTDKFVVQLGGHSDKRYSSYSGWRVSLNYEFLSQNNYFVVPVCKLHELHVWNDTTMQCTKFSPPGVYSRKKDFYGPCGPCASMFRTIIRPPTLFKLWHSLRVDFQAGIHIKSFKYSSSEC